MSSRIARKFLLTNERENKKKLSVKLKKWSNDLNAIKKREMAEESGGQLATGQIIAEKKIR